MIQENLIQYLFKLVEKDPVFSGKPIDIFSSTLQYYPPCDRIAFELPLSDNQAKIDFHINLKTLFFRKKFLNKLEELNLSNSEEWSKLLLLLREWNDEETDLFQELTGAFLEFDFKNDNQIQVPAFFAKLNTKELNKEEVLGLAQKIVIKLKGEHFFNQISTILKKCIYQCPQGSYLGYLGIMLSRPEKVLRLNIYNLHKNDVIPFLTNLKWKGNISEIEKWLEITCLIADSVIVSFDVFEGIVLPKIGLEVFITKQPAEDYRWSLFQEELEKEQLWKGNKKNILSEWSKFWTPSTINWHSDLILDSISYSSTELPIIKQLVSHIKLTITPNEETSSKIYLGLGHTKIQRKIKKEFLINNTPKNAIKKGLEYIISKQNQSGLWLDYYLPAGYGDEWITGFTGFSLAKFFPNIVPHKTLERSFEILNQKWRNNEGLGYNSSVPSDSDSTVWFLKFAIQLGKKCDSNVLNKFRNPDFGLGTYIKGDPKIKHYIKSSFDSDFSGWETTHDCVTSNAAFFDEASIQYLLTKIGQNKNLKSYWWKTDLYTLFLAYYALKENNLSNTLIDTFFKNKLENQTVSSIKSTFDKAYYLALCALCEIKNPTSEQFLQDVLQEQSTNGNWESSALLLVPMPKDLSRNQSNNQWEKYDINHIFTTTSIIVSIKLYCRL